MSPGLFAVCPHDIARGIEKWAFLNTFVNRRLGLGSRYGLFLDFEEFATALDGGQLLWAFLNPADFLNVRNRFGYQGIARPAGRRDVAYVVGRAEEPPAGSLEALAGKRLCSVSGYLASLVRHRLDAAGVSVGTFPARSYAEVMNSVGRGDTHYGVTYNDHFDRLSGAVRNRFRVEVQVDPGLAHVIAAHPSMPAQTRDALRSLLLGAARDQDGARLLRELGITAFEPVPDEPYRELEAVLGAVA